MELARFPRRKAVTAAGACESREVRIWKFDAFPKWRQADAFRLQGDQSKSGIVEDDDLDRQLVMHRGQKFAHQHVEAAIAAHGDHLARAIQCLYPVGLTKCRSDRGVVEGADNP